MEAVSIYGSNIYSIKYDQYNENEFDRLLDRWNDYTYLFDFFTQNESLLNNSYWSQYGMTVESAMLQIERESAALEEIFDKLAESDTPDYDSLFHPLDGPYKYEYIHTPVKMYGTETPSLLRLYAIKIEPNVYIITGGGIKLGREIQSSPDLRTHILQEIDDVRLWLKKQGINFKEDLN